MSVDAGVLDYISCLLLFTLHVHPCLSPHCSARIPELFCSSSLFRRHEQLRVALAAWRCDQSTRTWCTGRDACLRQQQVRRSGRPSRLWVTCRAARRTATRGPPPCAARRHPVFRQRQGQSERCRASCTALMARSRLEETAAGSEMKTQRQIGSHSAVISTEHCCCL